MPPKSPFVKILLMEGCRYKMSFRRLLEHFNELGDTDSYKHRKISSFIDRIKKYLGLMSVSSSS
jgi:hypothetical protein